VVGYELRADAYMSVGDTGLAVLDLTAAIERRPENSVLYLKRGEIYAIRGERLSAIQDLQQVLVHSKDPQLRNAAREGLEALK
jgi:tetratricopeptide (TPR) repeat protein